MTRLTNIRKLILHFILGVLREMDLYILRHAIAVERFDWSDSDDSRPLSAYGIAKMKQNATGLTRLLPKIDLILTSPYVRARQTAEIVCKIYGFKISDKVVETDSLTPDSSFEDLFKEFSNYKSDNRVMVVGHQPHLGDLISYLTSEGAVRNVPLKKGGVACIELEREDPRHTGMLHWLLTPKQLRQLAGQE